MVRLACRFVETARPESPAIRRSWILSPGPVPLRRMRSGTSLAGGRVPATQPHTPLRERPPQGSAPCAPGPEPRLCRPGGRRFTPPGHPGRGDRAPGEQRAGLSGRARSPGIGIPSARVEPRRIASASRRTIEPGVARTGHDQKQPSLRIDAAGRTDDRRRSRSEVARNNQPAARSACRRGP